MHINVHEISESNEYESAGFAVFPNSVFIAHEWLECFRNSIRKPIYLSFVSEGKTVGVTAGLTLECDKDTVWKHRESCAFILIGF